MDMLKACLTNGDVESRSAAGQRFTAFLKTDEKQRREYDAIKGQGAQLLKKNFRLRWAAAELASKTTIRRSKAEEMSRRVGEKGKYLAFDRMVVAEGGLNNPAAIRGATHYTIEALKRGHPWVEYNTWKKEVEILFFDKIRENVFTTIHSLSREEELEMDTANPDAASNSTIANAIEATPVKASKPVAQTPASNSSGVGVNSLENLPPVLPLGKLPASPSKKTWATTSRRP